MNPVPRTVLALLVAASAGVLGCASNEQPEAMAEARLAEAPEETLAPVVRGGTNGLEVLWFVCRDEGDSLASALAPYEHQPVDLESGAADSLRRNGLRLVRIPLTDFTTVRDTLRPVGPTQRSWLGWSLHWSEAFRARSIAPSATVLLDGDPVAFDAAGSRFLARAWGSPTPEGERVRVEFAVQLLSAGPYAAQFDPIETPAEVNLSEYELRRGGLVNQLAFETELQAGFVYLVVPADPAEEWGETHKTDSEEPDPPVPGFEFADLPRNPADLGIVFGPPAPAPLTLGQAILTSWDPFETGHEAEDREPLLKAIVALVPRCDSPARLLPAATNIARR